jgi:glycosyltransferase involved in cell wall biosynthesis
MSIGESANSLQVDSGGAESPAAAGLAPDVSVVIPTHNRAGQLRPTLESIKNISTRRTWQIVVVDNGSTDLTQEVVTRSRSNSPVELRYIYEPEPGRSAALNAGIRTSDASIVLTTDDDVRVEPDWLDAAVDALREFQCDYLTGKVVPIWEGAPPWWLPPRDGLMRGALGLLDFGPSPRPLTDRSPIGVNAAFRREAFGRVGLFDTAIGRKPGTLLGQEVRDWFLRARSAGLRGYYVPQMVVRHIVPAGRLTKRYFRRWFYWHGISRALMYERRPVDMLSPEHSELDFAQIPHIAGVPRYLYRKAAASFATMVAAHLRHDRSAAFEAELSLWRFAGIARQRWRDTRVKTRRRINLV